MFRKGDKGVLGCTPHFSMPQFVAATKNLAVVWTLTNLRRATAFCLSSRAISHHKCGGVFLRQSFGGATFTAWQTVAGKQTAPRLPDYNYHITLYVLEQYWEKMCNITINYKKI
jgi:hypothetical protein